MEQIYWCPSLPAAIVVDNGGIAAGDGAKTIEDIGIIGGVVKTIGNSVEATDVRWDGIKILPPSWK